MLQRATPLAQLDSFAGRAPFIRVLVRCTFTISYICLHSGENPRRSTFRDSYQEELAHLIQSKIEGKAFVLAPAPKKPAAPADLLAALQQSIAEAKASNKLLA